MVKRIRGREDLCGVGLWEVGWWETGGHVFLHRNVPIVQIESEQDWIERQTEFNYTLTRWTDTPEKDGYSFLDEVRERGDPRYAVRAHLMPGACESRAGADPYVSCLAA